MKLKNLISALKWYKAYNFDNAENIKISGIAFDSRDIKQGNIFVAIKGENFDGNKFIPSAIKNGASSIFIENVEYIAKSNIPCIVVPDTREALAILSAAFYNHPARKMRVIGVTGTDGKTTTATIIYQILKFAGFRVGLITSINAVIGDKIHDTGFHTTTPNALDMQKYLAKMLSAGTEYVVIEASSHGLAQHRVDMCEFDIAVITNITSEHLDYHKNLDEYQSAKLKLFNYLYNSFRKQNVSKVSIINKDDASYNLLENINSDIKLSYGLNNKADISACDIYFDKLQMNFDVKTPDEHFSIATSLLGRYNIYNILAAISVAHSQKISIKSIIKGIESIKQINGRMEFISHNTSDFKVIIDFAHTPNALEKALGVARDVAENNVIVVFGCAGLRDKYKRKAMGKVAGKLADKIFITTEDPRTESVENIIGEIARGCKLANRQEGIDLFKIPDRKEAITNAILSAQEGDVVIICGKAQEKSMCFGTKEYPWDEYGVVKSALKMKITKNI
ncbi:MAG: UDP-N-acetylmuramoyl-L-alanyl-D-glutamate--2,6-diaminopimelate ligase [Candidatus Cloacimonadota bacterium]|nr:UDP-N-acetylmuramoyl-L-alanyl-D-glutamate--2,6-diaminopimelate ligase [Candidatus Cloacimonadota bacterium]